MKREELIKRLRENSLVKQAINEAKDDNEKERVRQQAEFFATSIFDAFMPLVERLKNDPETLKEVATELQHVFNDSNEHVSGSLK